MRTVRLGERFVTPDERERIRASYRAQVRHADRELLRLLHALEDRGIAATGAVLFTSDHGEELFEHGGFEHGHSHHGEVIDIPLALVAPGVEPRPRTDLASLQDVASTVRAIAGLEPRGFDLRAPIPAGRVARAAGTFYFRPLRSARAGRTRVIIDGERATAYDLVDDPGELHPRQLNRDELLALLGPDPDDTGHGVAPQPGVDDEAIRALGYVH